VIRRAAAILTDQSSDPGLNGLRNLRIAAKCEASARGFLSFVPLSFSLAFFVGLRRRVDCLYTFRPSRFEATETQKSLEEATVTKRITQDKAIADTVSLT
jgi:hypothetical protein